MFCCNGILFNHESPRRGGTFVTKKITRAIAMMSAGLQDTLSLGNLDAKRDWGHAYDYVRMMWMMLQQSIPDDFVIATNDNHSVRDFCNLAFKMVGMEIEWIGTGLNEKGVEKNTKKVRIEVDQRYFRPTEVDTLLGDPSKAMRELGWKSEVSFPQLVYDMLLHDFRTYGLDLPESAREAVGELPKWMELQPFVCCPQSRNKIKDEGDSPRGQAVMHKKLSTSDDAENDAEDAVELKKEKHNSKRSKGGWSGSKGDKSRENAETIASLADTQSTGTGGIDNIIT